MSHKRSAGVALFLALLAPHAGHAFNQPACPGTCPGPIVTSYSGAGNGAHGDDLLVHAEVVPIFGGSFWQQNLSVRGQLLGFMQLFINGPYLDRLSQYRGPLGFGPARLAPVAPITTEIGPPSFQTQDAERAINDLIGAGAVPPPLDGATNMVYVVFAPPGAVDSDLPPGPQGGKGWNGPGACDSRCGSAAGNHYSYIVVAPNSNPFLLTQWSFYFTHELEEAISANMQVSGCIAGFNQLADVCSCYNVEGGTGHEDKVLAGTATVSPYWSVSEHACVVPDGWGNLAEYSGSGTSWSTWPMPSNNIVQVVTNDGGGGCLDPTCANLALLNSNGHVLLFNGDGTFTPIQTSMTFATLAAGNGGIVGVTADMSQIWRFTGIGRDGSIHWTQQPWMPFNLTAVASGVMDLGIDDTGSPWHLANGTWGDKGTPGDQFVVGNHWAAGLTPDHSNIFIWQGSGYPWLSAGRAASEMYIGGDQSLAVRDLTTNGEIYAMTGNTIFGNSFPGTWQHMIGPVSSVALFDSSAISMAALSPDQNDINGDLYPIEHGSFLWEQIGGVAHRIIGHGTSLLAVELNVF
jgi:hypothetical protein